MLCDIKLTFPPFYTPATHLFWQETLQQTSLSPRPLRGKSNTCRELMLWNEAEASICSSPERQILSTHTQSFLQTITEQKSALQYNMIIIFNVLLKNIKLNLSLTCTDDQVSSQVLQQMLICLHCGNSWLLSPIEAETVVTINL